MINKLLKGLVDLIYGVGRVKTNYSKDNPNERILAADGSKGITTKGDKEIERGLEWVTSQSRCIADRQKNKKWTLGHSLRRN